VGWGEITPPAGDKRPPCDVPPPGWACTRPAGHPGPCAARPLWKDAEQILAALRGLHQLTRHPDRFAYEGSEQEIVGCSCGHSHVALWRPGDGPVETAVPCPTFRLLNGLPPKDG
jgi:hypothetical protein